MPHLSNCPHAEDGWCGDCVKELGEEVIRFQLLIHEVEDRLKLQQPKEALRAISVFRRETK